MRRIAVGSHLLSLVRIAAYFFPAFSQSTKGSSFQGENGRGVSDGYALRSKWDSSAGVQWMIPIHGWEV